MARGGRQADEGARPAARRAVQGLDSRGRRIARWPLARRCRHGRPGAGVGIERQVRISPMVRIGAICVFAVILAWLATPVHAQEKPLRQIIDAEVQAGWQREKIKPAARCDDAAFLRRIHLDLVGMVPSYEETTKFLADNDAKK